MLLTKDNTMYHTTNTTQRRDTSCESIAAQWQYCKEELAVAQANHDTLDKSQLPEFVTDTGHR